MTTTAPVAPQKGTLFGALHNLADEITTEKQAAHLTKTADSHGSPTPDDPGGYQGKSTHPTTSVDNRGQAASEGARSSENVSDVKADQGKPGVDSTPDNTDDRQDDAQLNIGTSQSSTGEDPSVEDDYKAGKDDPGTSHPAATDNSSLDGHKYADASVRQLKTLSDGLANTILADLANGYGSQLTKEALHDAQSANLNPAASGEGTPVAAPRQQGAGDPPAGEKIASTPGDLNEMIKKATAAVQSGKTNGSFAEGNSDLAAGYELAAVIGIEKKAAQEGVADCLQSTIGDARFDADLFGTYFQGIQKRAMGAEPGDGEDHSMPGDAESGAGPMGDMGGMPPEGGGGDPMAALMGGGGGEEMGGAPPEEGGGMGALGELLGGGTDPGGMMPPEGGPEGMGGQEGMGGPGEEEALMQLVAALDELGIDIGELAQAGPPPEEGAMMGEGMKLASAAKAFRRSGKYQFKEATDGSPQRTLRNQMKGHLTELINFSA